MKTCSADKTTDDGLLVRCGDPAPEGVYAPGAPQYVWPVCAPHAQEAVSHGLVKAEPVTSVAQHFAATMDALFLRWCREEGLEGTEEDRARWEAQVEQWTEED